MKNNDYQKWVLTKDREYTAVIDRLQQNHTLFRSLHAVIGLAGEVGEVTDAVKKAVMYGKTLDVDDVKEEVGDILWYMALLLDSVGSSFEEVMQINHDKLEKRYPSGFTEAAAIARADKTEETPEAGLIAPESDPGSGLNRTRYFYKHGNEGPEFLSINQDERCGIWANSYDKNWIFQRSIARLNDFDGTCEDLLNEGFTEHFPTQTERNDETKN